ncbi:MAG: peptide deformylase [Patescibacteria group bacterium]
MLNIITAPNSVLSQSAKQISKVDSNILKLIEEMKKTLLTAKDPEGVGLAAPQIGKSLQIFLAKPSLKSPTLTFINPKVTANEKRPTANKLDVSSQKSEAIKLEGCLSLPNIWGEVKRDPKIKLQYQLITNNHKLITKTRTFSGFIAIIIQHETDHLNGILFPKRVLEQKGKLYKSRKNKKGEDVFEEIEL